MHDALQFIQNSGPVARVVLVILALLSLISWMVIFEKIFKLVKAEKETNRFLTLFEKKTGWNSLYKASLPLGNSPHAHVFKKGYSEYYAWKRQAALPVGSGPGNIPEVQLEPETLPRIMEAAVTESLMQLDRFLAVLSITVSVSPFLGLFGTVWGIMGAFMSIGVNGSADITTVGPGIAEALITTVSGLAVAIPALIAYNLLVARLRKLEDRLGVFSVDLIRLFNREKFQ